jgi:hypothetical protein
MRRGSTFLGILAVVFGVLFLLRGVGILMFDVGALIWPVALLALGAWVILGAATRRQPEAPEEATVALEGAQRAEVRMRHGAGRLQVAGGAPAGLLASGKFGGGVAVRTRLENGTLRVRLRPDEGAWMFFGPWSWGGGGALDWDVQLSREVPLALDLETGASDTKLDLADLRVNDLRLRTGASACEIIMPSSAGTCRARLHAGAASLTVRVPEGVAARIRTRAGLSEISVDTARFPRSADGYQSADYDTAANKADIAVEMGVGSVRVA